MFGPVKHVQARSTTNRIHTDDSYLRVLHLELLRLLPAGNLGRLGLVVERLEACHEHVLLVEQSGDLMEGVPKGDEVSAPGPGKYLKPGPTHHRRTQSEFLARDAYLAHHALVRFPHQRL